MLVLFETLNDWLLEGWQSRSQTLLTRWGRVWGSRLSSFLCVCVYSLTYALVTIWMP